MKLSMFWIDSEANGKKHSNHAAYLSNNKNIKTPSIVTFFSVLSIDCSLYRKYSMAMPQPH